MIEAYILKWCDNCNKFTSHKIQVSAEKQKIFFECIQCHAKSEKRMYNIRIIDKKISKNTTKFNKNVKDSAKK